jgi:hypothetical protein
MQCSAIFTAANRQFKVSRFNFFAVINNRRHRTRRLYLHCRCELRMGYSFRERHPRSKHRRSLDKWSLNLPSFGLACSAERSAIWRWRVRAHLAESIIARIARVSARTGTIKISDDTVETSRMSSQACRRSASRSKRLSNDFRSPICQAFGRPCSG